jgi:outer membrane protein TolC
MRYESGILDEKFQPRKKYQMRKSIHSRLYVIILVICFISACQPLKNNETFIQTITGNIQTDDYSKKIIHNSLDDIHLPLTISTALHLAIKNNPDARIALTRIEQARANIRASQSSLYPSINFYTEFVNGESPSGYLFKTIDQRKLPPNTNFNNPGWFENYETGIKIHYNLFSGGRTIFQQKIAQAGEKVARLDKVAVENELMASVVNAYYDTLAAQDYSNIARESVSTVEKQLRLMKVRFHAGGALKSDVLSLEVRLAQAKEILVQSNNQHQTAIAVLANLLGFSPDRSITPAKTSDLTISIPVSYTKGYQTALEKRPEIKKIQKMIDQGQMGIHMAKAGLLPQVNLFTHHYYDSWNMGYHSRRRNWTAGALLNWNIFDGLNTQSQIDKATSMHAEFLESYRKTILNIRLDVKNAYLSLDAANARLSVAQSSVENARESFNLVKKQYEGGSVNITRYLEAELDRNRSRIRATAAYYDREKGLANIARAIGIWKSIIVAEN